MSNVVKDMDEPLSPDSQAYVNNYSPSKESPSLVAFLGRRRLRVMNGQDPVLNPEKFTPPVDLRYYKWPTEEEARLFAAEVIAASKSEPKCKQNLFEASGGVRQQRFAAEAVAEPMPMQQLE